MSSGFGLIYLAHICVDAGEAPILHGCTMGNNRYASNSLLDTAGIICALLRRRAHKALSDQTHRQSWVSNAMPTQPEVVVLGGNNR